METNLSQFDFSSFCTALSRNESTWNGKTMDEILRSRFREFPVNYGQRLGEALLPNTHVNHFFLDLAHGRIDAPGSAVSATNISSLLQYLGTCTSLREVTLIGRSGDEYVGLCLRTLARRNPHNNNITALSVDVEELFPSTELAYVLNTTTSLRTLEVPVKMDNNVVVREALEKNQTLNKLILVWYPFVDGTGDNILTMLQSHQNVSVLLYEMCGRQLPSELITVLQASPTLRELRMMTIFDGPNMELLVDGLRECTTSLTRMSFQECKFSHDATEVLTTYFQNCGGADRKILSYELSFIEKHTLEAFPTSTGEVMTALLTGSCGVPALDLRGLDDSAISLFWNGLGAKASEIRLPSLKMDHSDWSTDAALSMYEAIPRLVHMRDLTVVVPQTKIEAYKFQLAVWKNGSLHHVNEYDGCNAKNRVDLYFLKVACQRNQSLDKLLLNTPWMIPHDVDDKKSNGSVNCESSILPRLFSVAQQAPRHAPNWILMGLLACRVTGRMGQPPMEHFNDSTIHPTSGRKRSRCQRKPQYNKTSHG